MANLNSCPTEILRDIMSRVGRDIKHLRNYTLVSKKFYEIAIPELYRHVDLNTEYRNPKDNAKSEERQARLLRSLAERDLNDGRPDRFNLNLEIPTISEAAKNMVNLTKAVLTHNLIGAYIVLNLNHYSKLRDLEVTGFDPECNIWTSAPISLTSLKWQYGTSINSMWEGKQSPLKTARFLLKVVEDTCPNLKSLEITFRTHAHDTALLGSGPEGFEIYQAPTTRESGFLHLDHFGFDYQNHYGPTSLLAHLFSTFKASQNSLTSISIPIDYKYYSRTALSNILKIGSMLRSLRSLTLTAQVINDFHDFLIDLMTGCQFYEALTSGFVKLGINLVRFSVPCIGNQYSERIGKAFGAWKNLEFLQVGDIDAIMTRSGINGHIDFDSYRPKILAFITSLPAGLKSLYLGINGRHFTIDKDKSFDTIASLGPEIFLKLLQLHTCDIYAWTSNMDGQIGNVPEKVMFWRRLPCSTPTTSSEIGKRKELWTSRMDAIYGEMDPAVSLKCDVLEAGPDQVFKGPDSDGAWCGGIQKKMPQRRGTQRGWQGEKGIDFSWPFDENKIAGFEMFRSKD